jgi:hypothetical protein
VGSTSYQSTSKDDGEVQWKKLPSKTPISRRSARKKAKDKPKRPVSFIIQECLSGENRYPLTIVLLFFYIYVLTVSGRCYFVCVCVCVCVYITNRCQRTTSFSKPKENGL